VLLVQREDLTHERSIELAAREGLCDGLRPFELLGAIGRSPTVETVMVQRAATSILRRAI
jgi:flagellar biosynthesis/type III secretory pathway M-ring protein FliF/YscJ